MSRQIEILSADKLKHYKKGTYSGSFHGMRYLIYSRLLGEEDETRVLSLCVWPEPYCFDRTAEDLKEYFQFDFTDEGLSQLEDTLNRVYEEKQAYWKERDGISLLIM